MSVNIKQFTAGEKLTVDEINTLLPCEIIFNKPDKHKLGNTYHEKALSCREKEIIQLIKLGLKNKEIAKQLKLAYETVKTHRKNIFRKLKINNVSQLIHLELKKHMTESEMFIKNRKHIFTIEQKISNNELTINELDEIIPGYLHINRLPDMVMTYVSPSGCNMFELTKEEIVTNYFELRDIYNDMDFIMKTSFTALVKFSTMFDQKSTFSFFQKIRSTINHDFELFCTELKLLPDNRELICITNPVSKLDITTKKLQGIFEENKFFDKNFQKFMSLTKREKEVLALVAKGYKNNDIGEQLFISNATIKTHRRHINKKLNVKHIAGLIKYADTFRLI